MRSAQLVDGDDVHLHSLTGGVSSDIFLVVNGDRRFVVKRALARLRVRADWRADVSRNGTEQAWLAYAARVSKNAVPCVLGGDQEGGWFAMEYFGKGFETWKSRLLNADARLDDARRAGAVLGKIHQASWNDPVARARFATLPNFHALRIEPYLLATAEQVPLLRRELLAEADRLATTELALVHGDFSPKNLLVGADRVIVVDAECGWFGDPAFDPAFLITHLCLKALLHAGRPKSLLALVPCFWRAYHEVLGQHADVSVMDRTVRLTLCLMLARVHGKSPVEYLSTPVQRTLVTNFVAEHLPHPPRDIATLTDLWSVAIERTLAVGAGYSGPDASP